MPVEVPGHGIVGSPLPAPAKSKPQSLPPANAFPSAKPRALPTPKPIPALQRVGFWGTIQQFNQRLESVVTAHRNEFGYDPSPGLALDVVRSPAPDKALPVLFDGQANPLAARTLTRELQDNPYDQIHVRQPGPQGPIGHANNPFINPQVMHAEFPMVPPGFLPIPGFHRVVDAMGAFNKLAEQTPTQASQTTQMLGPLAAEYEATRKTQIGEQAGTLQAAQKALQKVDPQHFADLPATGIFNADWSRRIVQYQHTRKYARDSVKQLAQQNNLTPDEFVHAWHNKQYAIQHNPALGYFAASLPLAWYAHHSVTGSADDFLHSVLGRHSAAGYLLPTTWLGGVINTAKIGFNVAGGSVSQVMADGAAANAFLQKLAPAVWGDKVTVHSAAVAAAKAVRAQPSLFHLVAPNQTQDEPGWLQGIDQVSTQVALLLAGHKLFTGRTVLPGEVVKLDKTPWFNWATRTSYNSIRAGEPLGVAARHLEGQGGESLVVWAKEHPEVTFDQYKQAAADLYHRGKFTYSRSVEAVAPYANPRALKAASKELANRSESLDLTVQRALVQEIANKHKVPVSDLKDFHREIVRYATGTEQVEFAPRDPSIFRSLRTPGMPVPGRLGIEAKKVSDWVRKAADGFDAGANDGKLVRTTHATDFLRAIRTGVIAPRAEPNAELRLIFGGYNRTGQDIYNWAVRNLKDTKVAHQLSDEFITARAKGDWNGINAVQDKMFGRYNMLYENKQRVPRPEFSPIIESDLPYSLYFPGDKMLGRASKLNQKLNDLAALHRRLIVSGSAPAPFPVPGLGGESLAWKHAVADTLRAQAGGRGIWALDGEAQAAERDVQAFISQNPDMRRLIEQDFAASKQGEFQYMAAMRGADQQEFTTGEALKGPMRERGAKLDAAAAYLRRHLNDEALDAYLKSSPDNLAPLKGYALGNQSVRRAIVVPTKERYGGNLASAFRGVEPLHLAADDLAQTIFNRYHEIDLALQAGGKTMDELAAVARNAEKLGSQEETIASFIKDNGLDIPIRKGLVRQTAWDEPMQWWIGKLMTANKWNRGSLYHNLLYGTVSDLTKEGWDLRTALPVASDIAKAQTVYHMLDFSNMLHVEQKLRWLSYFATKHRLYWTWVGKFFVRHPLDAAALHMIGTQDLHLDQGGNFNFQIGGHSLRIPALRLLWANPTDLPQTSPPAEFLAGYFKSALHTKGIFDARNFTAGLDATGATGGNIVTRSDIAWRYWGMTVASWMGKTPSTFAVATAGLPDVEKRQFASRMIAFSIDYLHQHGHLPGETAAVRHALLQSAWQTSWRANLPVPVILRDGTPPDVKALFAQLDNTKPNQKAAFIAAHPDLELWLGKSDPDVWFYAKPYWDRYNALRHGLDQHIQTITDGILQNGGTVRPADMKAISNAKAKFSQAVQVMLKQDATSWRGNAKYPKGSPDNYQEKPGVWGRQLSGDPLATRAFLHDAFPKLTPAQLEKGTTGQRIVDLRKRLTSLRDALGHPQQLVGLGIKSGTDDDARTEISGIQQVLSPFSSYPRGKIDKAEQTYYSKYVDPYRNERAARATALQTVNPTTKDLAYSQFRQWKSEHDHPVKIGGFTFPSPVQVGYSNLPAPQYHAAVAQMATADPLHLAGYELKMLGLKPPAGIDDALTTYEGLLQQAHSNPQYPSVSSKWKASMAKAVDQYYPGFYKFWLYAQKPKIERFGLTSAYQQMEPAARGFFTSYVIPAVTAYAQAISAYGHKSYYEKYWRNYVSTELMPWVDAHPMLSTQLNEYSSYGAADFLNTLLATGG